MRRKLGILLILGSAFLATEASAGPGQCFDVYGQPIGPVYDTDHPNYHWLQWVQARRGTCSRIKFAQADALRARGLSYPPDYYTASANPPGYRPGYAPPPPPGGYNPPGGWFGDVNHARNLAAQWHWQNRGIGARVWERGEIFHVNDRAWRVFHVVGNDGYRTRLAIRMRRNGGYAAMHAVDGYNWGAPFELGV
jgi:hypothetical protein